MATDNMTFASVVLQYLVVAEQFSELEPSVLPVVETLVLNHDAVKVLVEANLVVPLDIEEKIYIVSRFCVKYCTLLGVPSFARF